MSTIKANYLLDASGGNTAQVNGITPIDSSGALLANAAAPAGAVGSYALCFRTGATTLYEYGSTISGSTLAPSAASGEAGTTTSLSGTWIVLGFFKSGGTTTGGTTLCKRIS